MKKIPFYPMRPKSGAHQPRFGKYIGYDTIIARPKIDGSRVLVDVDNKIAWNRHGAIYSKSHMLPWDSLKDFTKSMCHMWQYVDIEFCDKHNCRKHQAVILDFPERVIPFDALMYEIADLGYAIDGNDQNGYGVMCNAAQDDVALLPFYDPKVTTEDYDDQVPILEDWWNGLIARAQDRMAIDQETTPFYEGMVMVKRDSLYIQQIASPTKVTHLWTKHRFSK